MISAHQAPTSVEQALRELDRLTSPDEKLAVLAKIEEERKRKSFIKYFEPWSEQKEALKKFTSDIKVFGLLGGNRSGKTILGSFIAVAWCLGKEYFKDEPAWEFIKDLPIPPPPNNVWVVGLDYGLLKDVIWYEKLRYGKSHPAFLPADPNLVKQISDRDFQIMFSNGSLLTGKSADAGREKFQGASVDLVWLDEECDVSVYDECYMRTSDCSGKLLLTLTPLTDINSGVKTPWVYDLYEDYKAGQKDLSFCKLSTLNSPFVPQIEKDRMVEKWKGSPEEGARLYGDFVRRSGLVYPMWDRKVHVLPGNFHIPKHWQRIVSIDPAATGITAALWLAIDDSGNMYAFREYYEKERIVSEHAKAIRILTGGDPVDIWLLDPTWGGQRNAETHKTGAQLWRESGIPVRLPNVGEDFGLHVSKEYLNASLEKTSRHPKFYILDGCPNFEFEITHYTYDTFQKGVQKGQSKDKPRKSHDHLLNAWQYAASQRFSGRRNRALYSRREMTEFDELFSDKSISKENIQSYT